MGEIMLTGKPPAPLLGAIHTVHQEGCRPPAPAYFNKYPTGILFGDQVDLSPATTVIAFADEQAVADQKLGCPVFPRLSLIHE